MMENGGLPAAKSLGRNPMRFQWMICKQWRRPGLRLFTPLGNL